MPRPFPNDGSTAGGYGMHHTPEGLAKAVTRTMDALSPIVDTFDALYVTGQSGEIPGAVVAYLLKKQLIILRKAGADGNHHSHGCRVEGWYQGHERCIILDDFCSSGKTLRELLKHQLYGTTIVGVCLYGHPRGPSEIEAGFSKEFYEYDRRGNNEKKWRLTRNGEDTIIFTLALAPVGVNLKAEGKMREAFDGTPLSMPGRDKPTEYASFYGAGGLQIVRSTCALPLPQSSPTSA